MDFRIVPPTTHVGNWITIRGAKVGVGRNVVFRLDLGILAEGLIDEIDRKICCAGLRTEK
jgi:hypothetical protein